MDDRELLEPERFAPAAPLADEQIDTLADRLWEQGHIQSLSKDTARIFARAVIALSADHAAELARAGAQKG